MARLRIFLIASVLCSLVVYGQGDVTTEKSVTITVPTTIHSVVSSSSGAPSSSSEAEKTSSTTPEAKPAETTAKSVPTAVPETTASSTTPASTTAVPTTAPTTPAPTTTSTPAPAPAPTPAPGPLPPPEQGMWSYTDNANVTCIVVQFAAQFNVTYTKDVNNATSIAYVLLNVPKNATVLRGSCNGTEQFVQLGWPTVENTLTLNYHLNLTTKSYALSSFNVSLSSELFPNSSLTDPVELWHGAEWSTPLATSYRCAAAAPLPMSSDTKNVAATLTVTKLQEEAFRTLNNTVFSAARDCGGGDVPDAVPIAVGCALGGLVVVVLIAYLIGRRRSAARGYLSM